MEAGDIITTHQTMASVAGTITHGVIITFTDMVALVDIMDTDILIVITEVITDMVVEIIGDMEQNKKIMMIPTNDFVIAQIPVLVVMDIIHPDQQ